jgi:hypothetical protein
MGYAHVRTGVRLDNSGCLTFIDASKDVLGEGREVAEVVLVSYMLLFQSVKLQIAALLFKADSNGKQQAGQASDMLPVRRCAWQDHPAACVPLQC